MWHVRETGEVYAGFWCGDLGERRGVNGRIVLERILKKWDWEAWTGLIWLRIVPEMGLCACGNDLSGYIKCR
jgi:hypothetical protein